VPGESTPQATSGARLRLSGSFLRLWLAQVVSSLGDWIGLVAILALTARIGRSSPEASIGVVMSARMIPGFFFGSVGGVLVDRLDRKRVMVTCDVGRGVVLCTLPLINSILGLFIVSLILEVFSLLWTPAKEATVPNLVEPEQLTTANSLGLAAAYGTFPLASAISALLFGLAEWISRGHGALQWLRVDREAIAIYADVLTFFASATLISTLVIPRSKERHTDEGIDFTKAFSDLKEGWQFIGTTPVVRAVLIGLGTGLIGGGMVVPLGPTFASKVLHGGPAAFSLLLTGLGTGVAIGVIGLSAVQKRLPRERIFPWAVLGAGASLIAGASMTSLALAIVFVLIMGVFSGAVYVVGFTLLQENVGDQLRGRIFATLYTLVRLCLIISLALAPLLASLLNGASPGVVHIGGLALHLQGSRLTLWLGGGIIIVAGLLARRALHYGRVVEPVESL
jgi:dTMP kinase